MIKTVMRCPSCENNKFYYVEDEEQWHLMCDECLMKLKPKTEPTGA